MAIESDVLVIGGGLAGLSAAIAAAREGAHVRLVSYKQSTLKQASGLVDVLGYVDGEPVADPFERMADLPDDHPYRIVGESGVREALALFDEVTDYRGGHTDRNALVPTHGGTVKPTARYPASAAPGLASDDRDALLVGFETLVDFDAPLAADHIEAAGVPFAADGATVRFPGDLRADAKVTRYAHLLDEDRAVETDGGRRLPAREALAERVRPHLDGHERVGFPAVLGDDDPAGVRAALSKGLGADVFEVPMGPPSLPGLRLADRLYEALDEAGASVETGVPVVDYEGEERVERVLVDRKGAEVPYAADQYVLATGGLVGKGVESDREGVREPVFDCRVPQPADRYDWFEDAVFGDHAFARFGVDPDGELRPTDERGDPEFENVRAAGSVLGGHDFPAEKSGAGVSLATGRAAGVLATEEL
ncbi:glycerol-3-phosphate dehydrogenase subunit GlpB [Halomicrobium salinisoli]|uniref:glycerol-3-phosphate dehydrogenase subunit GlpB n=1 Tax=Halomicrobium salinisoli TaxID=2878391 RepID=UPI001CEFCF9F|nr:glycerol-3-phosphate dehydrogenase subunit GlpB [Halomicrobium salinisoli]